MIRHCLAVTAVVIGGLFVAGASAEDVKLATYNIEHFQQRFAAHNITTRTSKSQRTGDLQVAIDTLKKTNDEDNWEISQVILDPAFSPDVLVLQEACDQSNLDFFNKRWLRNAYETAIVFNSNTERNQNLAMLLKPGFKVLERKDQYYLEKDPVNNGRSERLFARGPVFCLIQSPGGYKFWVGVTHGKSKVGDSPDVTKWRHREAKRTHEIMMEISRSSSDPVILMGDMNDDIGVQDFEPGNGGDVMSSYTGPAADGCVLVTKPLADAGQHSFHGYWKNDHDGFFDHIIITAPLKDRVEDVEVFAPPIANQASDHYPVYIKIKTDGPTAKPWVPPAPGAKRTQPARSAETEKAEEKPE